jgi:hypothetical protein
MCIDNPTNPDPGALAKLQDAEIAAQVRKIFADPNWLALRIRYPGYADLDLLKLIARQAQFLVILEMPNTRRVMFLEDEFAR